jgi:predicted Zn-dependent protease
LEKARDLAPESPETRVALASAYAKVGRPQDAARERAEFQRLKNLQEPTQ